VKVIGCSYVTVSNYLKKYNISIRKPWQTLFLKNGGSLDISIGDKFMSVFDGILIGDDIYICHIQGFIRMKIRNLF